MDTPLPAPFNFAPLFIEARQITTNNSNTATDHFQGWDGMATTRKVNVSAPRGKLDFTNKTSPIF